MNTTEPFRPEERQTAEAPLLTGSQALIESFLREGVETVFGYPGGAIIPVYDALYDYRDRLRHILVRHEQGAVHAAQGYARVSGRVGVCLVTSGPGATNTVTGLADALMDSTPLVLVTGQVGSTLLGTDAFQETNFVGITQAVTKWNCQVKYPEEIPAAIAKAFLSVGSFATDEMLTQILGRIRVADGTTVEQIQNQVETALMAERYYKVAKAYIIYRQEHTEDREVRDKLQFLMNYCEAPARNTTPTPTSRTRISPRSSASCPSRTSSVSTAAC